LLNHVSEAAACFVEIYNEMKDEDFSTLEKMDEHMQNKEKKENDKKFDSECSEDYPESNDNEKKVRGKNEIMTITMCVRKSTIVCEKEDYFKLKH
jgi:hypothetical protein